MSRSDIGEQLGHSPTISLDAYAHVMGEQRAWSESALRTKVRHLDL
jgi:hypothetical protein